MGGVPQQTMADTDSRGAGPLGGCYGVQVLVAGRRKHWRDEVAAQVRRAGYRSTACDSGVDALTVLALGLPVDVLVADVTLQGDMCCAQLTNEARALRPGLRIVVASDLGRESGCETDGVVTDALLVPHDLREGAVASAVRDVLARGVEAGG